jgi:hypothetical protein
MSITAKSLVQRIVDISQDKTSIRWPVNEIIRALNDAQREIVLYRPDAMVTNATLALVAGAKQSLPANGTKLIDIPRNTGGGAIRLTNREILDAQTPGWYLIPGVQKPVHYTYDIRDPKVFYVYQPALLGASLEIVYSANPTDITEVTEGAQVEDMPVVDVGSGGTFSVKALISVPDIYANAMVDFALFKIYLKDAEYAGNAARAQNHYTLFGNALGNEFKALQEFAPTSKGNPNTSNLAKG